MAADAQKLNAQRLGLMKQLVRVETGVGTVFTGLGGLVTGLHLESGLKAAYSMLRGAATQANVNEYLTLLAGGAVLVGGVMLLKQARRQSKELNDEVKDSVTFYRPLIG